jgi:V/A-type H+-transporting ATPase subunit E
MGETIEEFVAKLHAEGVQAGQQQADQVLAQAQEQADRTLADARNQAEKIIAEANAEAKSILERGQTELQLATRDVAMKLRESLGRAIQLVLARGATEKLQDAEFLSKLLHEIVIMYAKADLEGKDTLAINVPAEMQDKLADWAISELHGAKSGGPRPDFDLKATLAGAGFEYNAGGATVEVTPESVVQMLSELVGPSLRRMLAEPGEEPEQ